MTLAFAKLSRKLLSLSSSRQAATMMTLFSKPASSNDTVSESKGCGGKAVFSLAEAASGLLLAINLHSSHAYDSCRCLTEHLHPVLIGGQ